MITYELAKQLEEAGWKQPGILKDIDVYYPSLSELIEACGDFSIIAMSKDNGKYYVEFDKDDGHGNNWNYCFYDDDLKSVVIDGSGYNLQQFIDWHTKQMEKMRELAYEKGREDERQEILKSEPSFNFWHIKERQGCKCYYHTEDGIIPLFGDWAKLIKKECDYCKSK